jgi:hypothetical protein
MSQTVSFNMILLGVDVVMEGAESILNTVDEAPHDQHQQDRHVRDQQRGGYAGGLAHTADGHCAEPGQDDERSPADVYILYNPQCV